VDSIKQAVELARATENALGQITRPGLPEAQRLNPHDAHVRDAPILRTPKGPEQLRMARQLSTGLLRHAANAGPSGKDKKAGSFGCVLADRSVR
jgi:hypothetical protein